jgi:RNase P subunit RPR2
MYEGDIIDLDYLDQIDEIAPLRSNKAIKKAAKEQAALKQAPKQNSIKNNSTIATKPVDATCNKCNGNIVGDLIGDIYNPVMDKIIPLISYTCKTCGHIGRRSVIALALPLDQYERKYFN